MIQSFRCLKYSICRILCKNYSDHSIPKSLDKHTTFHRFSLDGIIFRIREIIIQITTANRQWITNSRVDSFHSVLLAFPSLLNKLYFFASLATILNYFQFNNDAYRMLIYRICHTRISILTHRYKRRQRIS